MKTEVKDLEWVMKYLERLDNKLDNIHTLVMQLKNEQLQNFGG